MRTPGIFIVLVACSGSTTTTPPPQPPAAPPPRVFPTPDAPPAAPPPHVGVRGDACGRGNDCGAGMLCAPMLPGGYCMSPCGVTGAACDGACVETGRIGELCMKACTSDADCRTGEGYTCDPVWHACALPNMAAIKPQQCPGDDKRDAAFAASEAWSTSAAPGIYQFEPASTLASDGSLVTMYITRGSMFEGNVLGMSRAGQLDVPVKSDRQSHFDPWLAHDSKGTVYAVWYGFDGRDQNGEIAMTTSTDRGATWSAPVAVHDAADCDGTDGGECLDKPMIAIGKGPRGAGEVVYVMYAGHEAGLRVRASRDGGKTFDKAATALEGIYGNAVVGGDGRLHVVTLNGGPQGAFGSAQQKVEYTVSADGGATFAKAITASGRDEMVPFFFSNPSIAVDDARKWIYIAYARGGRDAKWDIALAASKDGGKTWTRTAIGDGCAIHMVPNLALDPATGTLHVAYYDSQGAIASGDSLPASSAAAGQRGSIGRFAHATCTPGLAKCTVQGAINSQPFAALSTVRHGSKWIGEYETLIVDAKRRVLHAAWSQPVDEGGKIVSRIFHATAKLR